MYEGNLKLVSFFFQTLIISQIKLVSNNLVFTKTEETFMVLIIIGIALFSLGHLFKRVLPYYREKLDLLIGTNPSKGIVALFPLFGIIFITYGYYVNDYDIFLYSTGEFGKRLTYLIMILAVISLAQSHVSNSHLNKYFRHPMLYGVILWSIAHLLSLGTLAALLLFGLLGLWSVLEIYFIEKAGYEHNLKEASIKGDIKLVVIVTTILILLVFAHVYLGANMSFQK